ncbi:MAG: Gfo/Idh/MocA family oxidoreductase [Bacteroidales bacterium]|nr:Gfo/Idh/MocA family oxidoreductase [Bacteroidales bacterium]
MNKQLKAGLIGCGDYLRWEIDNLNNSKYFKVKYTFDIDKVKSRTIAGKIGAQPADSDDVIFDDPKIDIVMIFTPPWIRIDLFQKAADSGKHIITTKPLAPNVKDAEKLFNIVHGKVNCAVFYGRTGNANVEKIRQILDSGEIGSLALYKEDWFHHYPTWNDWATDPEKNGGPFMDAMVHNLNKSIYLAGSAVKSINYFSDNFAQSLMCNDTEFMKVNFENGASSYLFITWAADLEVFDPTGNDREHYGILHMITDQGWYITEEETDTGNVIRAKKEAQVKEWIVDPLPYTPYDDVSISIQEGKPQKHDISLALNDIKLLEIASANISEAKEII